MACGDGHLLVAQWLYEIKPTLNISVGNEWAFQYACANGHLLVAQWLYQVKPTLDISAYNEYAFKMACDNGYLLVAQFIQSLNPNKYIIVYVENNNQIQIKYKIVKTLNKSNTILYMDQLENCPICNDSLCNLQTSCNHTFCESCIQTWFNSNNNNTCPYCRASLADTMFQPISIHGLIEKV
jgi:hypothetical protein